MTHTFEIDKVTDDGRKLITEIRDMASRVGLKLIYQPETEDAFACYKVSGERNQIVTLVSAIETFLIARKIGRPRVTLSQQEFVDHNDEDDFLSEEEIQVGITYVELARVFLSRRLKCSEKKAQALVLHAVNELKWEKQ
ncbi:MAG: hypothetical protein WBP82_09905 [Leuconostoc mesenteroides]